MKLKDPGNGTIFWKKRISNEKKRGEIGEKGKVAKSMYFIQQVLIHVVKKNKIKARCNEGLFNKFILEEDESIDS